MKVCPFCDYEGPSAVLADYGDAFVIEPINPVTQGHVLVIPRRHIESTVEAPLALGLTAACAARYVVEKGVGPCNIITSHGLAATQTIFHLHTHIVPRRSDDHLSLPWSLQTRAELLEQERDAYKASAAEYKRKLDECRKAH